MTPKDFLEAIWPAEGYFALATPFIIPNTTTRVYAHKVFNTIHDAAAYVERIRTSTDIYFCIHSLRERRVWNPRKTDRKTGKPGAFEVRTQANMLQARCFFLDLDVGSDEKKYGSQSAALAGLIEFTKTVGLPRPLITSSGTGLHVYWPLASALPSETWVGEAAKLRALAMHHGLRADPSRTTDSASVLRVAGTSNFKDPEAPQPVQTLSKGPATDTAEFLAILDHATVKAGITINPNTSTPKPVPSHASDLLGSNIDDGGVSGPPVTMKALATVCAQVQRLVRARGDVSEPEWYHSLNLVRFVEDGDRYAHKISEGHPGYSKEATDTKLAQLREKGIQPTSCLKLAEVCGADLCLGCAFSGRVKSPIVAARYRDPAPAPIVQSVVGTVQVTTVVPDPPKPYTRLKGGGLSKVVKNKDGDDIHIQFFDHDLFPLRRLVNAASELEQQIWCVTLPRTGATEFTLDADALYDKRKFVTAISNRGLYPHAGNVQELQDYMIAYIAELQKQADAEAQNNHLGWTDDYAKFILPDKILHADGSVKVSQLGLGAARASVQIRKKGTLERQVELLHFYDHPAYTANQFYILAGLGAPIFYATGHHGVVINASGDAGASKSTSLYTASSFWGQPELYPINGTNNGATVRGRNERVTTLANLPVCVDEITHMPVRDAVDLAMSITQPGHRIRLTTEGVERASTQSYKATMMLTTANNSLHDMLSVDNSAGTAGSMRVFEIRFKAGTVHRKYEADEYWRDLKENYGHIGEPFINYVIQHRTAVEERVREIMKEVDVECEITAGERFWSAAVAASIAAGEIAVKLGLLNYNTAALLHWAKTRQIPYMRGVVSAEYTSPLGVLADFLETINGDILVTSKAQNNANMVFTTREPRGRLLAHYDRDDQLMWVLKTAFKDYCIRVGANSLRVLEELAIPTLDAVGRKQSIVSSRATKKVLGAGTDYAKAQSRCFTINMRHPDITGAVDLGLVTDTHQPTAPAAGVVQMLR